VFEEVTCLRKSGIWVENQIGLPEFLNKTYHARTGFVILYFIALHPITSCKYYQGFFEILLTLNTLFAAYLGLYVYFSRCHYVRSTAESTATIDDAKPVSLPEHADRLKKLRRHHWAFFYFMFFILGFTPCFCIPFGWWHPFTLFILPFLIVIGLITAVVLIARSRETISSITVRSLADR
jgi:hypothetical protein